MPIHIRIPGIPPTDNHAYIHLRKAKKRVLSKDGERYKNETKTFIAQHYPQELKFFEPNRPYTLIVEVTFKGRSTLICETYPEKATSRYQSLDAMNRIKLFADAFAEATGVDDRAFWSYTTRKNWDATKEEINLWAWCPERETSPFDDYVRALPRMST
jgi:hypothetical protein